MKNSIVLVLGVLVVQEYCYGQRYNFAGLVNGGTCTASSNIQNAECRKALDSRETLGIDEWVSFREGAGAKIAITFAQPGMINEVRFLQRCPVEDQSQMVKVDFQDGSSVETTLMCIEGSSTTNCHGVQWECVVFTPRLSQTANITVLTTCGQGGFTGFREITVLGTKIPETEDAGNLVLAKYGGTCESSTIEDEEHTCDNAINEILGAAPNQTWASSKIPPETLGAWIKLSLPSESAVSRLRLMNKCFLDRQMKRILVEYNEGDFEQFELVCRPGGIDPDVCPEQPWDEIPLPNIRTTGMKITCLETCLTNATNVGFQEVEILGTAEGDQSCPFDFDQQPFLSSCYKFITAPEDRVSLEQARDVCSGLHPNAHLVEINNMAEQDYLARTAESLRLSGASCSLYYTDGHLDSGDWKWFVSGSPVILPFWSSGTPSVGAYMAAAYTPGAGPFEQWTWVGTDGIAPGCFLCEIYYTGL